MKSSKSLSILICLAFLDIASTLIIFSLGGTEINPLMNTVTQSIPLFIGIKILVVCGIYLLATWAEKLIPHGNYYILAAAGIIFSCPVINNMLVLGGVL